MKSSGWPLSLGRHANASRTFAAGIGLAAALASIVDAILLRPLPVARHWEIARVFTSSAEPPLGFVSYFDYEDFRKARSIQDAITECLIPVALGDPPQIRLALEVTANYFNVLGVNAAFGRVFSQDEDRAQVAILKTRQPHRRRETDSRLRKTVHHPCRALVFFGD